MTRLLLIAAGGGLGSVSRYVLGGWVQGATGSLFPFGTLAVNVLGCLVIGFMAPLALNQPQRTFFLIGVLGGFTTFSTFGLETFRLIDDRQFLHASANILMSVGLGLGAVWFGYRVSEWLYGVRV